MTIDSPARKLQSLLSKHAARIGIIGLGYVAFLLTVADMLAQAMDSSLKSVLSWSRILIPGLAYKKNIPDIRESPTFKLMESLEERDAPVKYHDLYVVEIPYNTGRKSAPVTSKLGLYGCWALSGRTA